jgi:hypothetical protein
MIPMTYMNAELELVKFDAEDVLATSGEGDGSSSVLPEEEL